MSPSCASPPAGCAGDHPLPQVLDALPQAALVLDTAGRVLQWNTACEQLTGLSRAQVLGRRAAEVAGGAAAALPLPLPALELLAAGDAAQPVERAVFAPVGGRPDRWLAVRAVPLRDAAQRLCGVLQCISDDTERRRQEAELARHRNRLEQLVQVRSAQLDATVRALEAFVTNAPIGVAFSTEGVIVRINRRLCALLGRDETALVGQPETLFTQRVLAADAPAAVPAAAAAPAHDEPGLWLRHADGRQIRVQVDMHRSPRGTWWMVQDRTEIHQAQQALIRRLDELGETNRKLGEAQGQLLQQDKMASIGVLAAGVAHEINNPVGFVNANMQSLQETVPELLELLRVQQRALQQPDRALAHQALALARRVDLDFLRQDLPTLLSDCSEGLDRVRKIVQDLKDFSRIDNVAWQRADLLPGLASTLNLVRHEVRYKADVVQQLAPLPPVLCVPTQINQVLMNLIVNAAQAIDGFGRITLSSGCDDGRWVWIAVEDSGCGMTEEVRRRIFDPFYTTKPVGQGTGLGLALCDSIAKKHGGSIQVRSTPGAGSVFRLVLPVDGPQDGAGPDGPGTSSASAAAVAAN